MTRLNIILTLGAAFLVVFLQSTVTVFRNLLGAQPDLLPSLVAYAALTSGMGLATSVAVCGGLWTDALSRNPLGISILPLFLAALIIERYRGLILREESYAQFITGLCASAAVPALTLMMMLNSPLTPLVGWGSVWQWVVMAVLGGAMTPLWFRAFGWMLRMLSYESLPDPMSSSNRQIKRGRN